MSLKRPRGRAPSELRPVRITRNFTKNAPGSVLVEYGDTRVICTACVENGVPRFRRGSGQGWMTAEYSMLPSATNVRTDREAVRGQQSGRTVEVQRLIGRALRQSVQLEKIGERTLRVDCDVIQADGGTRTASITGGCVALVDALRQVEPRGIGDLVASVSVGIVDDVPVLDLEYAEDVRAGTDMNIVMNEQHQFIEVQGTAEKASFSRQELDEMISLAESGIGDLVQAQRKALSEC